MRAEFLKSLNPKQKANLLYKWVFWARPKQLPPDWRWRVWALICGRGFGKTRVGAELVRFWAETMPGVRIALVGATAADVRDVMIQGESGLLAVCPAWNRPIYMPSKRKLIWRNGSVAYCYSSQEPARLRGPQHHKAWADEQCAWRRMETWKQLRLGLRLKFREDKILARKLGVYESVSSPQCVLTTTPKNQKLLKEILAKKTTAVVRGSTYENRANLADEFLEEIGDEFGGTQLGRQELDGEIVEDVEGALFKREWINEARVLVDLSQCKPKSILKALNIKRVIVAVDPAKGTGACEYGIIVVGEGQDGFAYVLEDYSGLVTPAVAYKRTIDACTEWGAWVLAIEWNRYGKDFYHGLKVISDKLPQVKKVQVQQGKSVRSDPFRAYVEKGRVKFVGHFGPLEGQMCGWVPNNKPDDEEDEDSPDRMDALIHGLAEIWPQRGKIKVRPKRAGGPL